ncbi:specifically androgen-regulated gene protein [Echinops telfairi]|uniref:Specifically androgen-regulated gene protein n=1 Tax=Echinops telfairi TaxID=9371 RepID=A0AC55DQQ9_ECHTE|nr:specifically androgen-regulated gene protein [Echinops telfairi]
MPERQLWPEGLGSEPGSRIGSCDSMMSAASTHSGSSDSSYDFLSAAEKECLLFLEETIGSLDTEADSGLSTDESEPATTPQASRAPPPTQPAPQAHPEKTTVQPASVSRRKTLFNASQTSEPQGLGFKSGSHSLPRNIHISRSQKLRKSATETQLPNSGASQAPVPETESQGASQSSQRILAPASPQEATPHLDVVLIPPPEAFRDSLPEQRGADLRSKGSGQSSSTAHFLLATSPQKRAEASTGTMFQKPTEKGSVGGPGQAGPSPALSSPNAGAEDAHLPPAGDTNARPVPLTAPKPRKLPPNIVLKSSRSSFHSDSHHWLSPHSEVAPGDSGLVSGSLQEQRKARREALEKLGLPQDQDESSLHLSKPTSSLRLKEPPARATALSPPAGPAQVSAAVSASGKAQAFPTPPPGRGASAVKVPAPAPAKGPSPVKASAAAPALGSSSPGKVLIPAQEPSPGKASAAKSTPMSIPKATRTNSPPTLAKPASGLILQESNIPGLRQMNFKSKTLERSGVGLSSYLSAEKDPSPQTSSSLEKGSFLDKISPSVLRSTRPRPASLGTGKDFEGIQVGKLADLKQEQDSKRFSLSGHSRDKLPRPPCISVRISPKGVPEEHRREALKKLGLLKE